LAGLEKLQSSMSHVETGIPQAALAFQARATRRTSSLASPTRICASAAAGHQQDQQPI